MQFMAGHELCGFEFCCVREGRILLKPFKAGGRGRYKQDIAGGNAYLNLGQLTLLPWTLHILYLQFYLALLAEGRLYVTGVLDWWIC